MKIIIKTSILTAIFISGATAFAALPGEVYSSSYSLMGKFYISALGGYGLIDQDVANTTSSKKNGATYGVDAGWMITPNWGVETGYQKFPNATYTASPGFLTPEVKDNYAIHIAGVGNLPFDQYYNVYAKLGLANVHADLVNITKGGSNTAIGAKSEFAAFGAVGLGYNINKHVNIFTEANLTQASSDVPEMYSLNAGIAYIF